MKQYINIFLVIGVFVLVSILMTKCGKIECGDMHNRQSDEDITSYGCKGTKKYNQNKRNCMSGQLLFYFANPKQNFINLICASGCPEVGMCM